MARKRSGGAPWLTTFADLMSLLMAVFVLLFAMSTLEIPKYQAAVKSLREALDGPELSVEQKAYFESVKHTESAPSADIAPEEKLYPLYESLIESFAVDEKNASINVDYDRESDEIRVTFPEEIAFDPGRAELKEEFRDLLLNFDAFYQKNVRIRAIGHTDKRPVKGGRFKSNWELSSARAASVVIELVNEEIVRAEQAEAIGLAETQPLSKGDSEEDLAKNRRVEILIVPVKAQGPEAGVK